MGNTVNQRLGGVVARQYIQSISGVPVGYVSNGTVATNGVITLVTALPTTYSGGIWLRLPAGAVVGGAAGLYWAVMSSTTVGQVYTNFADPANEFIPRIPTGALVAAVGSNAAYTQTTGADITLVNVTLAGGSMGPNGSLRSTMMFRHNNSAGNKIMKYSVSSTNFLTRTRTTSTIEDWGPLTIRNRGAQNINVSPAGGAGGSTTDNAGTGASGNSITTVDFSADQPLLLIAQLATATDFVIVDGFDFAVSPS